VSRPRVLLTPEIRATIAEWYAAKQKLGTSKIAARRFGISQKSLEYVITRIRNAARADSPK